jgi:hypothetical protein
MFRPPHVLSDALRDFLTTQPGRDLRTVLTLLPAQWNAYVMGGLLRDLLLERALHIRAKPSDIDVVIFGAESVEDVRSKLGSAILATNSFGGVKCRLRSSGLVFDLWRAEDHTNMASARKPLTIEQLLQHNLLDIDAILWDPKTDRLHDGGCLKAIIAERIGLQGQEGISQTVVAAQIVHVLTVAYKTNFPLTDDLRRFIVAASQRCPAHDVEDILDRKIPHAAAQLKAFWQDILQGGAQQCPTPARQPIPQPARAKRNSSSPNIRH